GIDQELLAIGEQAAAWRRDAEAAAAPLVALAEWERGVSFDIPVDAIAAHSSEALSILWPAMLAEVGLVLDRRGTERLAAFPRRNGSRVGARIQLSGGWEVFRGRDRFEIRRDAKPTDARTEIASTGVSTWSDWSFR